MKKRYPVKAYLGTLSFKINSISNIDTSSYSVMGEYHLVKEITNADDGFYQFYNLIQIF